MALRSTDSHQGLSSTDDTTYTQQSTETNTTKPTNHVFVFCNKTVGLYQAATKGQLGKVKSIIQHGLEDINCRGKYKRSPAMEAATRGQEKVFDFLISQGCQLFGVDCDNNNILHLACIGGNTGIVRKLVSDETFDVESRGFNGKTPIMTAAKCGNREVFVFLMNHGSNMQIVDYHYNTILHVACLRDRVEMVKYILSLNIPGIDVESRGFNGKTAIMTAVTCGNSKVFDFLMNRGSNMEILDNDNNTILHIACFRDHVEMVKYILSLNISGIDVERKGYNGKTVVLTSAQYGGKETFNWLVSKGCDLSAKDDEGNNILHSACIGGNVEIVKYVLTLGKGYETLENKSGYTPVQLAKSHGYGLIVALLLRNG